ncbi:MAG: TolC family protein [Hydrogenophaga sp.]|uniref:TolC family protein n=1 Tax=Hydrogenophaga sp. TaxID=1904254 RepID=UPI002ABC7DC6|nr:TolC family protein [Hydrogenophaga sp.]MDZ4100981.1 TolC family protein [Hydrogenophaga sp.]MDZ4293519.1 TolC family protein [Hydrogenophaga sp.]
MRFISIFRASLWSFLALANTVALGQESARLTDLLRDAALWQPVIKSKESERQAAVFELEAARWSRYPSLSSQVQTVTGGAQAAVLVKQPIWTGGRITSQIDLAKATLDGASASVSQTELLVLQQTTTAFFEILRLEARLRAALLAPMEY